MDNDRRGTFAALRHRNYRLWFFGQLTSLFGTWMQTTAQGFLVFQLTRSPSYLGLVGFASGAPTWLLTLYGGVVADRVPRARLMTVTQTFMMILAFILAGLTFAGVVQPWHVLVLASLLGIANSFDAPARQSFVSEMVSPEDLTNAIALNSMMFQAATVVGPAMAGVAYALFGPGWCFTINGVSFIAVIAALSAMRLPPVAARRRAASAVAELAEGARYIRSQPTIRVLICMIAVSSMFGLSFATLIPAWSVNVLGGGAETNGLLFSARGVGALLGALIIASLGARIRRGRLLVAGSMLWPLLFAALSRTSRLSLSLLILASAGVGSIFVNNLSNALVQTATPERLRGRVMGAYTWIFFGFMPLGALWSGMLAGRIGEQSTVLINGGIAFAFALAVAALYPKLREE
ncbi:MAG TPA: MFS transporter [Bacteroidota bacterium]|nr:MFS transporter [Bacteroidota bacterium]